MKKRFLSLKKEIQFIILVGIYFSCFICLLLVEFSGLFAWLFIIALIFVIILSVWFCKNNKKKQNINQYKEEPTKVNKEEPTKVNKEVPTKVNKEEPTKVEITKTSNSIANVSLKKIIEIDGNKKYLKYVYKESLCSCCNFNSFVLKDKFVNFKLEEDNEFDPNTIAVFVKDVKIGLMYKGDARDIVNSCLKNNKYYFVSTIIQKDDEKNIIKIIIGFYSNIEELSHLISPIIKTSKKDSISNEKRYYSLELLNEGDLLSLCEDYESDGLVLSDDYGNEVGELSESISCRIKDECISLDDVIVIVNSCEYNENSKLKVNVDIYYKKDLLI